MFVCVYVFRFLRLSVSVCNPKLQNTKKYAEHKTNTQISATLKCKTQKEYAVSCNRLTESFREGSSSKIHMCVALQRRAFVVFLWCVHLWCFWWWCGGVFVLVTSVFVVVFLWWCVCGGVLALIFFWWCSCAGLFVVCVLVVVWSCLCGGVLVPVFLWWWCFCVGVVVFLWWCLSSGACVTNHKTNTPELLTIFTEKASKMIVLCDASDNFHRTTFQNERFARCFQDFSQKKLPKCSVSCKASFKLHTTSFQNERFVRCFKHFSQKKLPKRAFRAHASDNFHRKSFQNDRFVRGFLEIS